jgi:NAD(P)-dependent dehydrogenase (short-subunit alcohol dehydrogenase family)
VFFGGGRYSEASFGCMFASQSEREGTVGKAFDGKVVLVTGANSGIGEGAVSAFHAAGARVFGLVRRQEALDSARTKHAGVRWLLGDVANEAQAAEAVAVAVREAGRLDVVINNAGIGVFTPLEQSTSATIRQQFEVNVYGPSFVARAALEALKSSKGSIVNVGSAAGHRPMPNGAHYGATKAALESLTRSWALELAPYGVRVNTVAPGPTDTPVFSKLGAPPEAIPSIKESFIKHVPLGRIGTIQEVVHWLLAVADPAVTWMTGQVISIDGGMSLTS